MFDILKGLLPILFSIQYLDVDNILFALVLCAPVIGHAFPFFGQWIKGGKGIAVSFGCFAGITRIFSRPLPCHRKYITFTL